LRAIVVEMRSTQLRRRSARHVSKVQSQLAESSMANKSASGPGNAPKYPGVAMVGDEWPINQCGKYKAVRSEALTQEIKHPES